MDKEICRIDSDEKNSLKTMFLTKTSSSLITFIITDEEKDVFASITVGEDGLKKITEAITK